VHDFKKGVFRIAQRYAIPIVPMSIVGSYEFFQTGHWMLHPGKITIYLHDTLDPTNVERPSADGWRKRVQEIVAGPVEESLKKETPQTS